MNKPMFARATITRISKKEFETIELYTRKHWLPRSDIPGLGREPRIEQELVAVVAAQKRLRIERILRLQTAFPDMLVKLQGKADSVHLELELYSTSFLSHRHHRQVRGRRFKEDRKPVALLCWIDDDKDGTLAPYVHRAFELRTLLRERRRIRW